ncbi:MAG: hypothetical protein AAFX50_22260, partial [Acidobacteriota bacterium]
SISVYLYRLMKMSLPEHLGPDGDITQSIYELVERARADDTLGDFARGRILIHAGRVLADMDDSEAAMSALTEGVELVGMPSTERGRFLRSLAFYDIGYLHYENRRNDQAEQAYLRARESLAGLEGSQQAMIIAIDSSLASVLEGRGDYMRALELHSAMVEKAMEAELPPTQMGSQQLGLGYIMFRVGDREAGLDLMRRGYEMSLVASEPYDAIPLGCQRALGALLLEDFRYAEAAEVFEDYGRNLAAGPGSETFSGRAARVLALLARHQVSGGAGELAAFERELDALRRDFPRRLEESFVPQHLIATDLVNDRPDAFDRAAEMLAELDRQNVPGHAASASQLFARASLRGGDPEVATTLLADSLERHRALLSEEAPLLAEFQALVERAESPLIAAAPQTPLGGS